MEKNELQQRSKEFAHRCVKLCLALPKTILGRHIKGQLIFSLCCNYTLKYEYTVSNIQGIFYSL